MSLLLRRRAALEAAALDENDGRYCYAVGISASYSNTVPWVFKSTDYGATWHAAIPITNKNHYWTSQSEGMYFSRLAINDERVCWVSGGSARYHLHETEIDGVMQINSGSTGSIGTGWSKRTNFCISTGSYIDGYVDPQITYFGVTSASAANHKTVGRFITPAGDSTWQVYTHYLFLCKSASACSRDGQYVVVGGNDPDPLASLYSVDRGTTWNTLTFDSSSQPSTAGPVNDACMSADGRVAVLATDVGLIYSLDYMTTWFKAGSTAFVSCCISADGKKLFAANKSSAYGLRYFDLSSGWTAMGMISDICLSKIRCNSAGDKFIAITSSSNAYTDTVTGLKGRRVLYCNTGWPDTWTTASFTGVSGGDPYYAYVHDIAMSYTV